MSQSPSLHDRFDLDPEPEESEADFRERWRRQSEEWDRTRELERRLDLIASEMQAQREHFDARLDKLVALVEQSIATQNATNEVLDRFMALANEHDRLLKQQRRSKAVRRK